MIRKGQVEEIQCVLSEVGFINKIVVGIAAYYFDKCQENFELVRFLHQRPNFRWRGV